MFTSSAVALPPKKRSMQGRRIILVDCENVAGGAMTTPEVAVWMREVVEWAIDPTPGEQVVVATSHVGMFNARAAWPCSRLMVRSGPDGADLELIQVLTEERIEERFDEVVLVSGDGIFAGPIAHLGGVGVKTSVVSRSSALSKRLHLAAREIILLDDAIENRTSKEAA